MPVDRYLAPDIEIAASLVRRGALSELYRAVPELPALWVAA
jgi:hypothetical protein